MSSNDVKLKTRNLDALSSSNDSTEQENISNAKENNNSKLEDNISVKRAGNTPKSNQSYLDYLKKYLKEDKFITPAETMKKLQKETDLKVSIQSLKRALIMLRKEMGPEYVNLYRSIVRSRLSSLSVKLKDSHLEHLKKYLRENIYIGNTEATKRLYQDTGLIVSVNTVRVALKKLEHEIKQENSRLPSSESDIASERKQYVYGLKLNELHIEYLRKYLIEDSSIGCNKARNKLKEDTELEVSIHTMRKALLALKQEMKQEVIESPLPGLKDKVRCRTRNFGYKIKDSHLECLKKYLNENNFIGPTDARDRLYKESGLEVSVPAIQRTLLELKEQNKLLKDRINSKNPDTNARSKQWNYGRKLKDVHIECLKKYLNEDSSIGSTAAKNRLIEETGIEISVFPIQNALIKLRKEIDQAVSDLPSSILENNTKNRCQEYGYKLKDSHIECIKRYLEEDSLLFPTEAKNRLQEETGLKVTKWTVAIALRKLREKMGSEYNNLDPIKVKSKLSNSRSQIKDLHLELINKYFKEDSSIKCIDATKRLQEETCSEVYYSAVWRALEKLRAGS